MLNSARKQFDQLVKCMGYFYNNYNMEKTSKCVSVPMGIIFPSQCTLNNIYALYLAAQFYIILYVDWSVIKWRL